MKTKTMKMMWGRVLLLSSLAISTLLVSCGNDDGEEMMEEASEPVLEITVGGTTFLGDFSGNNAAIIATTNPNINWTNVTMGGSTTNGETINFSIVFDGKNSGTSTVSGGAGEDENAPQGLTIALVVDNDGTIEAVRYDAINVTINITSYRGISGITAEVIGNFSGTVVDEEGTQFTVSGSFNTGNFQ